MSDAELGEELVRLASADNFRDVTGPDAAYVAADGRPLRRGVAYRSNELLLTAADAESLARLGITAVYDLRSDHEVELHPDVAVPGATWTQLEVKGIPMDAVTDLHDRATAHDVMLRVYRGFVEVEGAREAFAKLFREIADGDRRRALPLHRRQGPHRLGRRAAAAPGRRRRRARSSRTTCSPTASRRRPARSTSAWSANTSVRTRSTSTSG